MLEPDAEYNAFRSAVDALVRVSDVNGMVLCGTMGHYSMMQTGYPSTPSWYPSDATDAVFRADRYAWQNKLYDILWMKEQGFVVTATDEEGKAWASDYLYISESVLSMVSAADIMDIPVTGMRHHPLRLILNY